MREVVKPFIFICLLATTGYASAEDLPSIKPLEIGVAPYSSARVLVASYESMRIFLEKELHVPVKIYTSAGFKQFFKGAQRGDFDMVISAAHFSRILQKEYQFTPLVRYATVAPGMLMISTNSKIKSVQELRGQVIAVPDQLSMASIFGISYLREQGLQSGVDFQILVVPTFDSAIMAIQKGDAIAAFSARAPLTHMSKELRESVTQIANIGKYFSLVFLAHPRVDKKDTQRLTQALLKFGKESIEGKQFLSSTGFVAIIPATSKDMNTLDRFVEETKRLLVETE